MIKVGDNEIDCLLRLLVCSLKNEKFVLPDNVNIQKLLALAVKQQVYTTVLPCLESSNSLTEEESQKWKNFKFSEIQKNLVVSKEREAVCKDFDEAGIKYMFLKGLVIRDYYPQTLMRQMSDNDILYDVSKRTELIDIMKKNGFYLMCSQDVSDDFSKPPFTLIEMHKVLFYDIKNFDINLDLWKRAVKHDDSTMRYDISPEDNYIYALAHMYKHYVYYNGCGIRFVADMYLLHYSEDNLDFDYIIPQLKKFKLYDFYKSVMSLAEAIFNDADYNDVELKLLDEIFSGGVYGNTSSLDEAIEANGGKLKFLFAKIFPSKKIMFNTYDYLKEKPYLLFPTYIKHFFIRYKYKGDSAKKLLKKVIKK